MLKLHTLVLKNSPYHTPILAGEALTHTLFFMDTVFWLPRGPLGSHSTSDPLITTAYIWCNTCPNFVLLALLVPEILTRLGGCDVITPLSFIICIDLIPGHPVATPSLR